MPRCLECGTVLKRITWKHLKGKNCISDLSSATEYQEKYPDASIIDPEVAKSTAITLENLINKYGEVEGNKRWTSYKQKQAYSNSYEYKKEKHGWSEKEFNLYNKSRAVTLENLIKKHGDDNGKTIWDSYREVQAYTNTIDYYIDKYGEVKGKKKWVDYNHSKGKSRRLDYYINELNMSHEEAKQFLTYLYNNTSFSSIKELEFISDMEEVLGDKILYSAKYDNQFSIWCHISNSIRFYDLVFPEKKKIIEFYGDYWHCNPRKYSKDFVISQSNKSAKQTWEDDNKKILTAKNRGFDIYIVWEMDYDKNKEETLKRCKEWLM